MARRMLREAAMVGSAGLIAGALKGVFIIVMGKSLAPEDFGIVGVVFALMGVVAVAMSVFNAIVFRYISYFQAKSQEEKLVRFLRLGLILTVIAAISIGAFFIFFARELGAFVHVTDLWMVRVAGIAIALELVSLALMGVLTGLERYSDLAKMRISQGVAIVLGGFAFAGLGAFGGITAFVIGGLISIPLGIFLLKPAFFVQSGPIGRVGIWRFAAMAVLVSVSLGVLINIDVLMARAVFSPVDAGVYSAAALVGSVLYLISETVSRVMFPKVAKLHSDGKDALHLLREGAGYCAFIGSILTLFVLAFPGLIRSIVFGDGFGIEQLLKWYVPSMLLISVIVVFALFRLAVRDFSVGFFVLAAAFAKIAFVLSASSPYDLARGVFFIHLGLFVGLILVYKDSIRESFRKKKGYFSYLDLLKFPQMKDF